MSCFCQNQNMGRVFFAFVTTLVLACGMSKDLAFASESDFFNALKSKDTFQELFVMRSLVSETNFAALGNDKHFDFTVNDENIRKIADILIRTKSKIKKLTFECNEVGNEAVRHLTLALIHRKKAIEEFILISNKILDSGVEAVTFAVKYPGNKIKKLTLDSNGITKTGVEAVASMLKHADNNVERLTLVSKSIGNEEAEIIVNALIHPNNKVKELTLQGVISNEGAKAIARALRHTNNKLEKLNLMSNQIGDEGAKAIIETLQTNKRLQHRHLILIGNPISEEIEDQIDESSGFIPNISWFVNL